MPGIDARGHVRAVNCAKQWASTKNSTTAQSFPPSLPTATISSPLIIDPDDDNKDTISKVATSSQHGDIVHWRMPGEDDAGQADRVCALNDNNDQEDIFSFDSHLGSEKSSAATRAPLVWDWEADQADRERERRADGDNSFQVDRRVLRDVVKEVLSVEVVQIRFISSGALATSSFTFDADC